MVWKRGHKLSCGLFQFTPRPKGGGSKWLDERGYVRVATGHPRGYEYEHRLVVQAAGVDIPDGYVVHHRDGDTTNNELSNLEVMSRADHNRVHDNLGVSS